MGLLKIRLLPQLLHPPFIKHWLDLLERQLVVAEFERDGEAAVTALAEFDDAFLGMPDHPFGDRALAGRRAADAAGENRAGLVGGDVILRVVE